MTRRLVLAVLAALGLASPGAAWACSANGACPNLVAACCVGNTCTIDGNVTVTGSTCTLDFGLHNVILTGTLAIGSNTVTIRALSFTISGSGLLDGHGVNPSAGGNVIITTTDRAITSFASTGNARSGIDLTGFGTGGGSLEVHAAGPVALTGGRIDVSSADSGGNEDGGSILIDSTADDLTVGISLLANGGTGGTGGSVTVDVPGNVMVNDSGRIAVSGGFGDAGTIGIGAGGTVTVANSGLLQANGIGSSAGFGGTIDILAATGGMAVTDGIRILGTLEAQGGSDFTGDAGGDGGSISLEAAAGALVILAQTTRGFSADGAGGGGEGQISLQTDDGDITIGAAVSAVGRGTPGNNAPSGGEVEVTSAGGLTVTKSIDISGIDSGGLVALSAARDVVIQHSILGGAPLGGGSVTIDAGHDVTFTDVGAGNSVRMSGLSDGTGGDIGLSAGNDVTITGFTFNTSGSSSHNGGTIVVDAGRNLTVATGTTLNASAGANAPARGGDIVLTAGFPDLAGNLTIAGDVLAAGHDTSGLNPAAIQLLGCQVLITSTGTVDSRGDTGSSNTVVGRTRITVNGRLRATGSNTPSYPVGTPPTVDPGAQVQPAFPTPVACPACAKPVCTQRNPPAPTGCLMPCPQCGDGVVAAPFEDCDAGAGDPCMAGCDIHCRSLPAGCTDGRACTDDRCDPVFGCLSTPSRDGTGCDDSRFCTSGDTCHRGVCVGGPPPSCNDANACTTNDRCNPTTDRCDSDNVVCVPPDPNNRCYGTPPCSPATGCGAAPLTTCPPGEWCNPADGSCGPKPCTASAECDDQNPCTNDVCSGNLCANPAKPNGPAAGCGDSALCNGTETCQSGVCAPGPPPNCADTDLCTVDSCDDLLGCQNPRIPGCCVQPSDCSGHNECTSCIDNTCGITAECCFASADCDDGNDCTDDGCNMTAHRCSHVPTSGEACGDVCNPGTCTAGTCDSAPRPCVPDNDPCTDDFCDPASAGPDPCVHRHRDGCCQTALDCDDQSTCTTDTCDRMVCLHTEVVPECKSCGTDQDCAPDLGPGSPGGACAGKRCQAGVCMNVAPPSCDNAPQGFVGRCVLDAAGNPGCVNLCVNDGACDDHDVCNGKETCSSGSCVAGTPLQCNDHNLCTDDTCDPASGCPHPGKTRYDAVRCQLDTMDMLLNESPGGVSAATRIKLGSLIGKARAKLSAAETVGQGRRAGKLLKATGTALKAISKAVKAAARKKKITDPALARQLIAAVDGGGGAVADLKKSLTP